jgi:oxygen-independent coproporphyrinogen-3 oxidase
VESRFGIVFSEYFAEELASLAELKEAGFVEVDEFAVCVTEAGRLFVRNACMAFDRYLKQKREASAPVFSRTV